MVMVRCACDAFCRTVESPCTCWASTEKNFHRQCHPVFVAGYGNTDCRRPNAILRHGKLHHETY